MTGHLCVLFLLLWMVPDSASAQVDEPAINSIPTPQSGLKIFQVVTDQSILRIKVERDGMLARMGHNHVITHRAISGTISIDTRTNLVNAQLQMTVADFLVDDAEDRLLAGPGFDSVPSAIARADTRANMLRPAILDAGSYPVIRITANDITMTTGQSSVALMVSLKDRQIPLQLPATVSINGNRLQVESTFSLDHQDLGLRPFSVLGGALRVAETIYFELYLEAAAFR